MDAVKVHAHQAAAMTRKQALEVIAKAENQPAVARHMAELMLAGPEITPEDEARLRGKLILLPPVAFCVRAAFADWRPRLERVYPS